MEGLVDWVSQFNFEALNLSNEVGSKSLNFLIRIFGSGEVAKQC